MARHASDTDRTAQVIAVTAGAASGKLWAFVGGYSFSVAAFMQALDVGGDAISSAITGGAVAIGIITAWKIVDRAQKDAVAAYKDQATDQRALREQEREQYLARISELEARLFAHEDRDE